MSTASGARWTPLFEGDEAAAILEVVDEIEQGLGDPEALAHRTGMPAEVLRGRQWPELHHGYGSLGSGCAGIALVGAYRAFHERGEASEQPQAALRALAFVEESIEVMANVPLGPSLFSGYTGIAWAIAHLGGALVELDEGVFDEIESQLLTVLAGFRRHVDHCDLVDGLVGIGLYGLARKARGRASRIVDACIDRLHEWSEPREVGRVWLTPPGLLPQWQRVDAPEGYVNFGMAHGTPAILALLGHAAAAARHPAALPLLRQGRSFMRTVRQPPPGFGYPAWVAPNGRWAPGRLAWCYGDLGIAATSIAMTEALPDRELAAELRDEAVALARALGRRTAEFGDTHETGLCHGTAGIAHLFNRLHQGTEEPELADAARHWFRRTLELRRRDRGIGGYAAWPVDVPDDRKWKRDSGLLEGAAGVALALLASVSDVEPSWDQVLLCSPPGPPVA
jgi:lantibiotic modifying enzyme